MGMTVDLGTGFPAHILFFGLFSSLFVLETADLEFLHADGRLPMVFQKHPIKPF